MGRKLEIGVTLGCILIYQIQTKEVKIDSIETIPRTVATGTQLQIPEQFKHKETSTTLRKISQLTNTAHLKEDENELLYILDTPDDATLDYNMIFHLTESHPDYAIYNYNQKPVSIEVIETEKN